MHGIRPRQKVTQADWKGCPRCRSSRWIWKPPDSMSDAMRSSALASCRFSEIADAPDLDSVLDELLTVLAGRVVVVHFRNIERPFLDAAVKARRGEGVLFPMIDTMSLEARWHRQTLWARFRRWLGRPPVSIRLNASRERYGLPVYQGHHALAVVLALAPSLHNKTGSPWAAR